MAQQRKTSKPVGKIASKLLRSPSSSRPVKRVAASDLSQRAPQTKGRKK